MPMVAFADDGIGGDSGNGSGLFVGLDTGYTFVFNPMSASSVTDNVNDTRNIFSSAHVITLNADLLVNLIQTDSISFGAFVGIGLGYGMASNVTTTNPGTTTTNLKAGGFLLPINVGLSLTANNHHRFELGFKIPTLSMDITEVNGVKVPDNAFDALNVKLFTTSVGYSYIF